MSKELWSLAVLASFIAVVATAILGCGPDPRALRPVAQTDQTIDESRFYVLLFPSQAQLADRSGKLHLVKRAAVASLDELSQDTFAMFEGEIEHEFDTSDFSLLPNNGDLAQYLQELNAELKKWGPSTDWRSARFDVQESKDSSSVHATLTLVDHRGRAVDFDYEVDEGEKVKPLSVNVVDRAR